MATAGGDDLGTWLEVGSDLLDASKPMVSMGATLIVYGVAVISILLILLRLAGFHPPLVLFRGLAWLAGPLLLLKAYEFSGAPFNLIDFEAFWQAGADALAGRDPYDSFGASTGLSALNPPTAIPLFATFGTLPLVWANRVWVALLILGMLGLVEVCRRTLDAQAIGEGNDPGARLAFPAEIVAGLTVVVALSNSSLVGLHVGQLHLLAALATMAALAAQGSGRPILAGLALAVATMKPQTMLPFLLLFTRRSDYRTWLALIVGVVALCLIATPPLETAGRIRKEFALIGQLAAPGQVNDFSYQNPFRNSIVGLDALTYDLGIRDRRTIKLVGLTVMTLLAAGLVRAMNGPQRISRPAACALAACYSMLFMYHRIYDMVILALPLLYALGRSLEARGSARTLAVAAVVLLLVVMNTSLRVGDLILAKSWNLGPAGPLVRAILVPHATWALLAALGCLWGVARLEARAARLDLSTR